MTPSPAIKCRPMRATISESACLKMRAARIECATCERGQGVVRGKFINGFNSVPKKKPPQAILTPERSTSHPNKEKAPVVAKAKKPPVVQAVVKQIPKPKPQSVKPKKCPNCHAVVHGKHKYCRPCESAREKSEALLITMAELAAEMRQIAKRRRAGEVHRGWRVMRMAA